MTIPENPETCLKLAEALKKTNQPIPVDLQTRLLGAGYGTTEGKNRG